MTIIVQATNQPLDYDWLKAAIASWMHRSNLTGDIPDFIMLAESRIRALLTSRLQQSVVELVTTAGLNYVSLPQALIGVKSLTIPNVSPSIDYLAPDQFNNDFSVGDSGVPRCYTIIGELIYFGPTPDAVYTILAAASNEFTSLSQSVPTNALLTKWPNIYLWGALVEAAKFCRDYALKAQFDSDFLQAVDSTNTREWNTPGLLTVRTDMR